jgi:hypothetical protein
MITDGQSIGLEQVTIDNANAFDGRSGYKTLGILISPLRELRAFHQLHYRIRTPIRTTIFTTNMV